MPLSQQHVDAHTPMGANLVAGGAVFKVWAPGALEVHLRLNAGAGWNPDETNALVRDAGGSWAGFVTGVRGGNAHPFHVVGARRPGPHPDPPPPQPPPRFPACDRLVPRP